MAVEMAQEWQWGVPLSHSRQNRRGQEILAHLAWTIGAVAVLDWGPGSVREQWQSGIGRE